MEFDEMERINTENYSSDELQTSDFIHQDNETRENWIVYFQGKSKENFEDWLERFKPSKVDRNR